MQEYKEQILSLIQSGETYTELKSSAVKLAKQFKIEPTEAQTILRQLINERKVDIPQVEDSTWQFNSVLTWKQEAINRAHNHLLINGLISEAERQLQLNKFILSKARKDSKQLGSASTLKLLQLIGVKQLNITDNL
jgi:hypothetical protein